MNSNVSEVPGLALLPALLDAALGCGLSHSHLVQTLNQGKTSRCRCGDSAPARVEAEHKQPTAGNLSRLVR